MRSAQQNILGLEILQQGQITPVMMLSNADFRKPILKVVSKSGKREPDKLLWSEFRTLSQSRIFFSIFSVLSLLLIGTQVPLLVLRLDPALCLGMPVCLLASSSTSQCPICIE